MLPAYQPQPAEDLWLFTLLECWAYYTMKTPRMKDGINKMLAAPVSAVSAVSAHHGHVTTQGDQQNCTIHQQNQRSGT